MRFSLIWCVLTMALAVIASRRTTPEARRTAEQNNWDVKHEVWVNMFWCVVWAALVSLLPAIVIYLVGKSR